MPDIEFDVVISIGGIVLANAPIGINLHPDNTPRSIELRLDEGYLVRIENIKYEEV